MTIGRATLMESVASGSPGVLAAHADKLGREPRTEVYTPAPIIEAARASMGGIDLDPASCAEAQTVVRADRWIGLPDDGLDHDWSGRVWLNPPFRGGMLRRFARRMLSEPITAGCFLGPLVGGSTWPDELSAASTGIVMLRQHLPWWGPLDTSPGMVTMAVWLLGECDLAPWSDCRHVAAVTRTVWGRAAEPRFDLHRGPG